MRAIDRFLSRGPAPGEGPEDLVRDFGGDPERVLFHLIDWAKGAGGVEPTPAPGGRLARLRDAAGRHFEARFEQGQLVWLEVRAPNRTRLTWRPGRGWEIEGGSEDET